MARTSLFTNGRKLSREDDEVVASIEPIEITDIREDDDELNDSMSDTDAAINDLNEAFDIKEEAEEKVVALEALKEEEYTPYIAKDAAAYYKNLCKRTGLSFTEISTEDVEQTVRLSTEDIKEFISKIVTAIKAIIAKIVNFFKKLFGMAADVINNDEKVAKAEVDKIKLIVYKAPNIKKEVNDVNDELLAIKIEDIEDAAKSNDVSKINSIDKLREKLDKLIASEKETNAELDKKVATEDYRSNNIIAVIKSYASLIERNIGLLAVGKLYNEKIDVEKYYKTLAYNTNSITKNITDIIKNNELDSILKNVSAVNPTIDILKKDIDKIMGSLDAISIFFTNNVLTPDQINSKGVLTSDLDSEANIVFPISTTGKTITFLVFNREKIALSLHKTNFNEKGIDAAKNEVAGSLFKGLLSIDNSNAMLNIITKNKESIALISKYGNEAISTSQALIGSVFVTGEKIDETDLSKQDINDKKYALNFIKSYTALLPSLCRLTIEQLIYADKTVIKMFNHNRYLIQMGI